QNPKEIRNPKPGTNPNRNKSSNGVAGFGFARIQPHRCSFSPGFSTPLLQFLEGLVIEPELFERELALGLAEGSLGFGTVAGEAGAVFHFVLCAAGAVIGLRENQFAGFVVVGSFDSCVKPWFHFVAGRIWFPNEPRERFAVLDRNE